MSTPIAASTTHNQSLDQAPSHVKLAVDLLMVLEQNNIHPQVALEALDIVQRDLQRSIMLLKQPSSSDIS